MNITVNWTEIKTFVDNRNISLQYVEFNNRYTLAAFDGAFSLVCNIFKTDPKNDDQTDFENNYKSRSNLSDLQMNWFQRMSTQGKVFGSGTDFITISVLTEKSLFLLKNTSSDKKIYLFRGAFSTDSIQVRSEFRLYANPTVDDNGTQVPIANQKQGSSNTSDMEAYQQPTISSNGSFVTSRIVPQGAPTQEFNVPYLYTIDPGQNVLLTVENSLTGATSQIILIWVEL